MCPPVGPKTGPRRPPRSCRRQPSRRTGRGGAGRRMRCERCKVCRSHPGSGRCPARAGHRRVLAHRLPEEQRVSAGRQFSPSPPIQPVRVALAVLLARRIGWPYSEGPLKKLLARIRPEYVGIDPSDRTVYEPGQIAQCDLWFPETPVPVTAGQARILPVLVMTLAFSRFHSATMIPSRQAGDILSGMWLLISQLGRVPTTLVWDRESAIGGTGKLTTPAAAFAGTLATRIRLVPPRAPELKGMVERNNGLKGDRLLAAGTVHGGVHIDSRKVELAPGGVQPP